MDLLFVNSKIPRISTDGSLIFVLISSITVLISSVISKFSNASLFFVAISIIASYIESYFDKSLSSIDSICFEVSLAFSWIFFSIPCSFSNLFTSSNFFFLCSFEICFNERSISPLVAWTFLLVELFSLPPLHIL